MFKQQFKAITSIAPKHVTPERLIRIGMNAASCNPKLMECSPESIVGDVVNCSVLGVEPNLLGHAYIVPFFNGSTKRMEAQFQLGYRGLIDLARRTGEITSVYAHEVYEGDEFEYIYGLDKDLKHKPIGEEDESKITHFYAVYKLKDGAFDFIVMSRKQVIGARRELVEEFYEKSGGKTFKILHPADFIGKYKGESNKEVEEDLKSYESRMQSPSILKSPIASGSITLYNPENLDDLKEAIFSLEQEIEFKLQNLEKSLSEEEYKSQITLYNIILENKKGEETWTRLKSHLVGLETFKETVQGKLIK